MTKTLYPSLIQPPQSFITAVPQFESGWHQPWSEPVKQKIAPALAVALIASGLFSPVIQPLPPASYWTIGNFISVGVQYEARIQYQALTQPIITKEVITADKWSYPWSEPVRLKIGLESALQSFATPATPIYPNLVKTTPWFANLAEPVRVKQSLQAASQQFEVWGTLTPAIKYTAWFSPLNEPVRLKPGLSASLQAYSFLWPYPIQNPVFVTMSAYEVDTDSALFGIRVYNKVASMNVSVTEIPAINAGAASIAES